MSEQRWRSKTIKDAQHQTVSSEAGSGELLRRYVAGGQNTNKKGVQDEEKRVRVVRVGCKEGSVEAVDDPYKMRVCGRQDR